MFGGTQFSFDNGGNIGPAYTGRILVNLVQIKLVDGSSYAIADSQLRMIHGSMDYNDKVGEFSTGSVEGEMKASDAGVWYLTIDYGTNNTLWLDQAESLKDPYIKRIFGSDGDRDGFNEEYLELNFAGLSPLKAGEDKKEVEITLVHCPARTSSITWTSLTNASSIGTTSYSYKTATGYGGGFTEGDMAKIAKIELQFDANATHATYPDSEYWKLTHLKLKGYTWGTSQFGGYDLANTRFLLKFGDQVNHQGGKDLYYAKNAGDLWASYELKGYCKYPEASVDVVVKIKFYFYKPDGTLTDAFTEFTQFSS